MKTQITQLVKQGKAVFFSTALFGALVTSLSASAAINNNGATLINGDGSDETALCIAAAVSESELGKQMGILNVNTSVLDEFTCNGLPIKTFAKKYPQDQVVAGGKQVMKVFAFPASTQKSVANLCVAAATSNDAFKVALKGTSLVTSELGALSCNGRSIKMFAKKYGNRGFRM